MPDRDDLVIYELHVGTFSAKDDRRGTFDTARRRLGYLRELGVSAVQVMPPFEFAGDISWGYNPAHLFAIETSYGGPDAFKRFVRDAHAHGIAVIVDVVYNHVGPSDLDLWRFDGWSEGDGGGIYLYNDERAMTPWGATRPDYGRGEVRTFLRDSAMTWLEEFRCDGLRFDSTVNIRTVSGDPGRRRFGARRTAGRSWPGSTTRSGPASRGRSRSPRTSRTIRPSSHRPTRAAPASAPSGTRVRPPRAPGGHRRRTTPTATSTRSSRRSSARAGARRWRA